MASSVIFPTAAPASSQIPPDTPKRVSRKATTTGLPMISRG